MAQLDREALIFREVDAPEAPSKVDPLEIRAFVEVKAQVTAREVRSASRWPSTRR
jgi:hypothetical protein